MDKMLNDSNSTTGLSPALLAAAPHRRLFFVRAHTVRLAMSWCLVWWAL